MKQLNPDIQLAKFLGGFSLCLGTLQLMAGPQIVRRLGLPVPPGVIQAFGAREVLSGFSVLAHPDDVTPIAARIGGDAMDLAVLAAALAMGPRRSRPAVLLATAAVVGITLLDLAAAAALRRRGTRALETARRTRVRTSPAGAPTTAA